MEYLTEEQQVERLKRWWKEYGLAIIGGVVLAIIFGTAWRYYQAYRVKIAGEASMVYTMMLAYDGRNQTAAATQNARLLKTQFTSTPYASLAALWLAKQAVLANDTTTAQQELHWVISKTQVHDLKFLAQIRLARIDLQLKNPKQALADLPSSNAGAYQGMASEVAGDAYTMMGNAGAAHQAYQAAMTQEGVNRPLLTAKLTHS